MSLAPGGTARQQGTTRTLLPGGLRVVTEAMPQVRSATFSIWAGVGSRDEPPELAGAAHYLEHLLFKGTPRRDALEISAALDAVGGELNAFTAKEYTCFYARVLDADLPLAADVVTDLVTSSVIAPEEVERERGVILDEIAMHDDDPADAVQDLFARHLWGDSPLGRPILGTTESIGALTRDQIDGFYRSRYRPCSLVVAVAGNVEHDRVVDLVRAAFARAGVDLDAARAPDPPRIGGTGPVASRGTAEVVERATEQANLVLGMPGLVRTDDRRFAFGVLNSALGGGMSSRLFQEVREKRGLAYAVQSFSATYADAGYVGIYAGCQPGRVDEVLSICRDQVAAVAAAGITGEELARGKGQLRGSLVLGLEDSGSRMGRLAKAELVYGELLGVEEILRRVEAVTLDDVRAVAAELLSDPPSLAVIGPFADATAFSRHVAA